MRPACTRRPAAPRRRRPPPSSQVAQPLEVRGDLGVEDLAAGLGVAGPAAASRAKPRKRLGMRRRHVVFLGGVGLEVDEPLLTAGLTTRCTSTSPRTRRTSERAAARGAPAAPARRAGARRRPARPRTRTRRRPPPAGRCRGSCHRPSSAASSVAGSAVSPTGARSSPAATPGPASTSGTCSSVSCIDITCDSRWCSPRFSPWSAVTVTTVSSREPRTVEPVEQPREPRIGVGDLAAILRPQQRELVVGDLLPARVVPEHPVGVPPAHDPDRGQARRVPVAPRRRVRRVRLHHVEERRGTAALRARRGTTRRPRARPPRRRPPVRGPASCTPAPSGPRTPSRRRCRADRRASAATPSRQASKTVSKPNVSPVAGPTHGFPVAQNVA